MISFSLHKKKILSLSTDPENMFFHGGKKYYMCAGTIKFNNDEIKITIKMYWNHSVDLFNKYAKIVTIFHWKYSFNKLNFRLFPTQGYRMVSENLEYSAQYILDNFNALMQKTQVNKNFTAF